VKMWTKVKCIKAGSSSIVGQVFESSIFPPRICSVLIFVFVCRWGTNVN